MSTKTMSKTVPSPAFIRPLGGTTRLSCPRENAAGARDGRECVGRVSVRWRAEAGADGGGVADGDGGPGCDGTGLVGVGLGDGAGAGLGVGDGLVSVGLG